MKLFAARHARVAVAGLCYGRHDVPTLVDEEQAARTILENLGEDRLHVSAVWSSPTVRCRLPAERLARSLGVPIYLSEQLQEIDYGLWEGRLWESLERDDGERLEQWMNAWRSEAPPGGERVSELEQRVRSWLERPDAGGLLVGHAGVIRALWVILRGTSWEDAMAREIDPLEIEVFERPEPR